MTISAVPQQDPPGQASASVEAGQAGVLPEEINQTQPIGVVQDRFAPVKNLALTLFHSTQTLHGYGAEEQDILEQALRLRSARIPRSKKKPYPALVEFVRSQPDQDLSVEGQRCLAALIAFQRKLINPEDFPLQGLSSTQTRMILTLAAILEISQNLDHTASGSTVIQSVAPSFEGMWIIVSGPNAAADAAYALRRTRLWRDIGYPNINILLPEEAALRSQPFPPPQEKIGILPGDSLSEAGRKVMCFQFAQMLRHEAGTRLGTDIEALHDMRVATRRLRAAFEVFDQAFEPGALKPLLKRLRTTGRLLGAVRDLDVFMEKAQHYIDKLPEERQSGLNPLLSRWAEQRDTARELMLEYLDSPEYASFKLDFNVFLHTPFAGARTYPDNPAAPTLSAKSPLC